MRICSLLLATAVLLAIATIARGQTTAPADSANVRAAVERSLPFLEKGGVTWMNEKHCASCHNVSFLLWSHNEARARGIAVDETKLAAWTDWTWKFSQSRRGWFKLSATPTTLTAATTQGANDAIPAAVSAKLQRLIDKPFTTNSELLAALGQALTPQELNQHQTVLLKRATRPLEPDNDGGGLDTLSQLLLGRPRETRHEKAAAPFRADMQDLILRWQQPDGSWKAAGQLPRQNRPEPEASAVTTMWAVLALATVDHPTSSPTDTAIHRALEFLKPFKPGVSNESLITQLLVQRKFGQRKDADELLAQLLKRQNPDGGWSWRQGADSDAFATGQALYALAECAVASDTPAVARARAYLIQSQTPDGSWLVPSRAISNATAEGRLTRLAPIYRYWGTAWAAIGLAHTLPERESSSSTSAR